MGADRLKVAEGPSWDLLSKLQWTLAHILLIVVEDTSGLPMTRTCPIDLERGLPAVGSLRFVRHAAFTIDRPIRKCS